MIRRLSRLDAPIGSTGVSLNQQAQQLLLSRTRRMTVARRSEENSGVSDTEMVSVNLSRGNATERPPEPAAEVKNASPPTAASAPSPVKSLDTHRHQLETLHLCDALERLLGDQDGFDERLFVACQEFVSEHKASSTSTNTHNEAMADDADQDFVASTQGHHTMRQKLLLFFESPSSSIYSKCFFALMTTLVILSCLCISLETLPQYNPDVFPEMLPVWNTIDWVSTAIFTLETGARFTLQVLDDDNGRISKLQNAVSFLKRPSNIVEIVSLLPTYISPLIASSGRLVGGALRTTRLLRLLKFLRRFSPIRRLVTALSRSATSLLAPYAFLALSLLLVSSTLYFTERGELNEVEKFFTLQDPVCRDEPYNFLPQYANITINTTFAGKTFTSHCPVLIPQFVSIAQTLWWGIATFTTVGFGDLVPITPLGKLVASLGMIIGLLFLAMPIAVLGTNYTIVIQERKADRQRKREEKIQEAHLEQAQETAFHTPGENLLLALQSLLGPTDGSKIDLFQPSDTSLLVLDALLEASVKGLASLHSASQDAKDSEILGMSVHATDTSLKQGLFGIEFDESGLPRLALPLWMSQVKTKIPQPYRSQLGPEIPTETVIEPPRCLNRPLTFRCGNSLPNVAPHHVPEIRLYNEEIAIRLADLSPTDRESSLDEDPMSRLLTPLLAPISTHHFTLTVAPLWGETRTLLRPLPGRQTAVLRRRFTATDREGLASLTGDPYFGVVTEDTSGLAATASAAVGRRRSISMSLANPVFDLLQVGDPTLSLKHRFRSFGTKRNGQTGTGGADGDLHVSSFTAQEGGGDTASDRQHVVPMTSLEKQELVVGGECPVIALLDGDVIVVGSFVARHLPLIFTYMAKGEPIPPVVGGDDILRAIVFYQFLDNTANPHV